MSFRFFRRIKLLPGVTLNLSKSGPSLSFGPRGAKVTVGPRGTRYTAGLPGTGLHYTRHVNNKPDARASRPPKLQTPGSSGPLLPFPDLQAAQRKTRGPERDFLRGIELQLAQQPAEALRMLQPLASQHPDPAWLAGFVCINLQELPAAIQFFQQARARASELGSWFDTHGIQSWIELPVTPFVWARMTPCLRGVLLAEAECHQTLGFQDQALQCLEFLYSQHPRDPVVRLSLTELTLERSATDGAALGRVLHLTDGITNDSFLEAALLGYRAQALRRLGHLISARDVLTLTLRRTRDRPAELLQVLRYERALVYEALGQWANARRDLERLYAEDASYTDVAQRLGRV